MRTRVKICGLTRASDVEAAVAAGADAIGFVLEPSSKRYIEPGEAKSLCELVPPLVTRVGVFIKAEPELLEEYTEMLGLGAVQVHSPVARRPSGVMLIRAMPLGEQTPGRHECDLVLLDNRVPGSGKTWDWSAAKPLARERRIILAGGLTPENVCEAVKEVRPYAVDVSSGVESDLRIKDEGLMREFILRVRKADMEANG